MCVTRKKDMNSFQLSIIADLLVQKLKSALLNGSVLKIGIRPLRHCEQANVPM